MKKLGLALLVGLIVATLVFGVVYASPPNALPANQGTDKAEDKSPAIDDSTGQVTAPPAFVQDLPENKLSKIVFIHYAPDKKPPKPPAPSPTESSTCYGFFSGAKPKWNWVEGYSYSAEFEAVSNWATPKWDGITTASIFGTGTAGAGSWNVYDGKNSVLFGNYAQDGVLAVTAIWYQGKNIYEYDIMFDTDFFPAGLEGSYDLETVALHEFGHAAGLDDLYDTTCSAQVMYGYVGADEARTTFGTGDIAGIQRLYGP